MKKTIMIFLFMIFAGLYAQEPWEVTLSIEDADSLLFERTFGTAEGATDGYDVLLELPLFFGGDALMAYFPETVPLINGLASDYRDSRLGEHSWHLIFQNMPEAVVSWTIDSLTEEGTFEIAASVGTPAPSAWLDMRGFTDLEVAPGFDVYIHWVAPTGEDAEPPYVTAWDPPDGAIRISRETALYCEIYDDLSGVDEGSVELIVNGINMIWLSSIDSTESGLSVHYEPLLPFGWDSEVEVVLNALDLAEPSNRVSDTITFRTVDDSTFYRLDGYVQSGDPPLGVIGAEVALTDFGSLEASDTSGDRGYYYLGDFNAGAYSLTASAPGYEPSTTWLYLGGDTTLTINLSTPAPPEVLVIDYDSGLEPYYNESEGNYYGEEVVITGLLDNLGYTYTLTGQNPDIATLDLYAYTFAILITPVRSEELHEIISDDELEELGDWLADYNRMLWIAPDGGPDYDEGSYEGALFYGMFGAVYESDGRPAAPHGNVANLLGSGDDFLFDVDIEYNLNSPADNFIDELAPFDDSSRVVLESGDEPTPEENPGRMIFRETEHHRTVISSVLFGAMIDEFFPNSRLNILRSCMQFLEAQVAVNEAPVLPSELGLKVYPNPFNSSTAVSFNLPQRHQVRLEIVDLAGKQVKLLSEGNLEAGTHILTWEGLDSQGNEVPSGLYFYRLSWSQGNLCGKICLIK